MEFPALAVRPFDIAGAFQQGEQSAFDKAFAQKEAAQRDRMIASQLETADLTRKKTIADMAFREKEAEQQRAVIEARRAAAGGDIGALMAYDPQGAKAMQDAQFSAEDRQLKMVSQAAAMLLQMPEDQRAVAYQQMRPRLVQNGINAPEQVPSPAELQGYISQIDDFNKMREGQGGKQPSAVQEYEYAKGQGFGGSFADWKAQNRSQTNIVMPGGPNFEQQLLKIEAEKRAEEMGKLNVKTLEDYRTASTTAQDEAQALRQMQELLPRIKTGALGETALDVQKAAERAGITLDVSGDTSAAEFFQKLSNQMTLLQRKPGSGEMSDSDRDFFQNSVANLFTTPQGNAMAIEFGLRRAGRAVELEQVYEDWLRGDQKISWSKTRDQWLKDNPMFTATDRERAKAALGQEQVKEPSQGQMDYERQFRSLSVKELLQKDIRSMSLDEIRAYNKVLGNGQ